MCQLNEHKVLAKFHSPFFSHFCLNPVIFVHLQMPETKETSGDPSVLSITNSIWMCT
jgi:hypothetical protein